MTSQLVIFRDFFFRPPPRPRSEKNSRKSTNKKNLPYKKYFLTYNSLKDGLIIYKMPISWSESIRKNASKTKTMRSSRSD